MLLGRFSRCAALVRPLSYYSKRFGLPRDFVTTTSNNESEKPTSASPSTTTTTTNNLKKDDTTTTHEANGLATPSIVSQEELENALKEKDTKIAELDDKYRRVLAEMENVRERSRRELQQVRQFAIQDFSKQLLEVADILRMALTSIPESILKNINSSNQNASLTTEEFKGYQHYLKELYQGIELTERELLHIFTRHGLSIIDPHHQKFDPEFHQALYEVTDGSLETGSVAVVVKKGYSLHGRVLRPAQVGVSKKPSS